MSKLQDYLTKNGLSRRQFAGTIGVDESVLSRYCNQRARPGLEVAVQIERVTHGAVPASSWIPEDVIAPVHAEAENLFPHQENLS